VIVAVSRCQPPGSLHAGLSVHSRAVPPAAALTVAPCSHPLTPRPRAPWGRAVHRAGAGWRAARVLLAGGVAPCGSAAQARAGDRGVQDRSRSCGGQFGGQRRWQRGHRAADGRGVWHRLAWRARVRAPARGRRRPGRAALQHHPGARRPRQHRHAAAACVPARVRRAWRARRPARAWLGLWSEARARATDKERAGE